MEHQKEIGRKMRALREKKRLSLRQVGEALDLAYSYLARIERGYIPSMKTLDKIAEYYGVDISYFLGEEREIPKEMEHLVKKWYSVIKEAESYNYSPEDLQKIMKTLESIKKNQAE